MVGSYWKSNFEYNFVLNQFWIFCSPALKQMCLWWTSWNALFIHFNIKCMRAWLHLYETVAVSAFSWSFLCHRVSPSWYYCFQTEQRQGKQLRQCCQGLGILRWEKIYLSTVRTISLKINLGGGGVDMPLFFSLGGVLMNWTLLVVIGLVIFLQQVEWL